MSGFLWSQREAKHFHDVSRSEAAPSSQNHISQSWWRMFGLRATSVTSQWKTCRAVPAPVAPTAQDTHPLQPVGTVGTPRMLHYCWLAESFPSFLQHTTFLPQTTTLGIATCQNWTVQSRKSSTETIKHTVCGEGKSQHKTQTSILCISRKLKLSGPLGENLTQLCDAV